MATNSFIKNQFSNMFSNNGRTAFCNAHENISYGELKKVIHDFESLFDIAELGCHTPVLVHLPMGIDQAVVISALLHAGIPALVLPNGMKSAEVSGLIEKYPFAGVITNNDIHEKLNLQKLTFKTPRDLFFIRTNDIDVFQKEECPFSWLLYTSGTTGAPKMVMLTHENLMDRTVGEVELFCIKNSGRILNVLPFSHDLGFNQLLTSLYTGSTLEILVNQLPADLARKISKGDFDGVTGMPQIWNNLIKVIERTSGTVDYSGYITVSGGSMSEENLLKLRKIFNKSRIYKTYGQSETFRTFAETRQELISTNLCGKTLNGVDAFIIDDDFKKAGTGETGQLFHSGHGMMKGYWMDQELTELKIKVINGKSGVMTGDYFKVMSDDEYIYEGRHDDMVKHTGRRFFLGEIEKCLLRSENVTEACVVQMEDNRLSLGNEKLVAFIVTNKAGIDLTKDLRVFCARHMENFKIPDEFIFCKTLPITANSKIDRRELKNQYRSDHYAK